MSEVTDTPKTRASDRPSSLWRFLSYAKPYRSYLAIAIIAGIVRYLVPLAMPWTLKVLVDDYLHPSQHSPASDLHFLMMGICALFLAYGVASYFRSFYAGLAGHKIIFDLRQKLFYHVQNMSLSFFDRKKIGSVVAHMTSDIASAQNFVGAALVNTIMDLVCVVAILFVLLEMNVKLGLVSFSVIPCYIIANLHFTKRIRLKSRDIHDQMQEISGDLHEQFAGISTIQAFNREEAEAKDFRAQSQRFLDTVLSNVRLQSIALGVTSFLTSIGPILVLWAGVIAVWQGELTVGTLMAFYAYLGLLYQPIQRLTELNMILINSLAAMDRIFEVFDIYPEVQEKPHSINVQRVRGDIIFERVSFCYSGREPVLTDLTLDIPRGKTIALVGPSGAGKSTLVKLIPRFYDVTAGRILIDGRDIRDMTLKSLRQQIAIVSQEPILFSGTVAENIAFGKTNASMEAIRQCARAAYADSFIRRLPQGYYTLIGERGLRLSGGQRQRLAIARAFLKSAPIIILDEPTAALDAESEELIKTAMEQLLVGRTAIIIAHRLSTIEHAEHIVVIDQGEVIEQGSHQELLKKQDSIYRKFAEHQGANHLIS